VGDLAQQGHCVQRVEEIDASLRFCDYEIRRQGGAVPDPKELLALGQRGAGTGMLQVRACVWATRWRTSGPDAGWHGGCCACGSCCCGSSWWRCCGCCLQPVAAADCRRQQWRGACTPQAWPPAHRGGR
jgi:hypothetical protein